MLITGRLERKFGERVITVDADHAIAKDPAFVRVYVTPTEAIQADPQLASLAEHLKGASTSVELLVAACAYISIQFGVTERVDRVDERIELAVREATEKIDADSKSQLETAIRDAEKRIRAELTAEAQRGKSAEPKGDGGKSEKAK